MRANIVRAVAWPLRDFSTPSSIFLSRPTVLLNTTSDLQRLMLDGLTGTLNQLLISKAARFTRKVTLISYCAETCIYLKVLHF